MGIFKWELAERLDMGSGLLVPIPRLVQRGNNTWEFDRKLTSSVWFRGLEMGVVNDTFSSYRNYTDQGQVKNDGQYKK